MIKWQQSETLEELQPSETILINQVWARDLGFKSKALFVIPEKLQAVL